MDWINQREFKIRLLKLLFDKEITKKQFKQVLKIGYPAPAVFLNNKNQGLTEKERQILSLQKIYEKLGQTIFQITLEGVVPNDIHKILKT